MRELSLFTGAGGGVFASYLLGHRMAGYVEFDPHCQQVIAQRIEDGIFDRAPIFGDLRAFNSEGYARAYRGVVDLVSGGFPCQPFSTAAHGKNDAGKDHWPDMLETVRAIEPRWVFAENVSAAAINKADADLSGFGYTCKTMPLSPANMAGLHDRKRHWLLAHADSDSQPRRAQHEKASCLSHAAGLALWGEDKSKALGVADGVARRVQRLRAIGNGQVPLVAATAFRLLMGKPSELRSKKSIARSPPSA